MEATALSVYRLWSNLHVAADDAALGVADELDDFVSLLGCGELGLDTLHGIGEVQPRKVEVAVDVLNFGNISMCSSPHLSIESIIGRRLLPKSVIR